MTFPWLVAAVLGTAGASALVARFTRQYFVAAVAGGALILLMHSRMYFDYTSDDAYISYRYARNLSEGLGLVWNPGEYVEGYSNYLWVMILAGLHKAGADMVLSGRWLGFALGAVTLCGTYVLSTQLLHGAAGRAGGLMAVLLLAAAGPYALWSTAGLETSLFALLIVGAALLHIRESGAGHAGSGVPLSGAVWGVAALTRPDAPLLFAVSALFKAGEVVALALSGASRDRVMRDVLWLLAWAAGFALVFAPYFIWRYTTYDYAFPNTYYAKVGDGLDQYDRGLRHLAVFAREYAVWLLLLVPVAAAFGAVRRLASMYVLALAIAWMAYVAYVGGDALVRFRFLAPIMPLLYALIATSTAGLLQTVRVERKPPRFVAEGAVALASAALIAFTLQGSVTDVNVRPERAAVRDRADIGRWLGDSVPADTSIAVIPAGAIPFESRLETIDMLGISDEHIAHLDVALGSFAAGHEKYDSEYVLDRAPDIIIIEDTLAGAARDRESYSELAFGLIPARIDMLNTLRLWDDYEARSVEIREGAWFNLLVREDASDVMAATSAP